MVSLMQKVMWSRTAQIARGVALLCVASMLVVLVCAQPAGFREAEYDSIRTRGIENRERITSMEARIQTLEALKIEARLSRIESATESMQYWTRGLMIGIALLLIEAFGRFILTRRRG